MRSPQIHPPGRGVHPFGDEPPAGWEPKLLFELHASAWATPLMVAERAMTLMAQSAWYHPNNDETLSAQIYDHIEYLRNSRGPNSNSYAAIVDAVQIIACLRFSEWNCADDWLQEALSAIQGSLSATTHQDGSPTDSPVLHYERMWTAVLAQSTLTSVGHTLTEEALSLLCRTMQFLVNFSGPTGTLPLLGEAKPKIAQRELPSSMSTIAHVTHQWFGIETPGMNAADSTVRRLGCASNITTPWPTPRYWTAHKWETAGLCTIHNHMHRIVGRASDQSVWWAIDGQALLHGSGTNGIRNQSTLRTVRTDDRVGFVEFVDRRIRIEGSRLTIFDSPSPHRKRLHFPKGSQIDITPKGHTVQHELGLFDVRSTQQWAIDEHSLVLAPNEGKSTIRIEYRRP